MGWLIILVLAGLSALLLWRLGGLPRSAFEAVAATLLLGIAGYALQGRPTLPDSPRAARVDPGAVDEEAIAQRKGMGERFGSAQAWLIAADGAMRAGMSRSAVTFIKSGLRENPDNADLWVGLGNALVVHADGMMSPAAQYAFGKAAELSPDHPGPPFFTGLAYAQSGQIDQARAIWSALLARTPPDAPWRADLEARLAQIGAVAP
ncbi:cytochrome C biogenesis protein [Sphingomonas sp. SCN 67-18]|uniref:tetratricopeptide repeat protein n=1 Tax=uncultured Sphingomonas sp. TaxID=158754 RepID=UPI000B11A86E|nr:cytochrome C biogenesis protein [Sphingomonas sp. SCN 67-18]